MTVKPIRFNAHQVRATLDGRKTRHSEVLKPQPEHRYVAGWGIGREGHPKEWVGCSENPHADDWRLWGTRCSPPYVPGDLLWVRETFAVVEPAIAPPESPDGRLYRADWPHEPYANPVWKASIHMPRWASRLTLEVTDVRIERVQDISAEDALAEGVGFADGYPQQDFAELWNSLNAKRGYGWDANPWVVAVTFKAHHCNVDSMEQPLPDPPEPQL